MNAERLKDHFTGSATFIIAHVPILDGCSIITGKPGFHRIADIL
jgi:hypothetical protein